LIRLGGEIVEGLLVAISLAGDGALVEVELPAVVAEDPDGRTVGDRNGGGSAIGGEGYILRELFDVKVVDGRGAGCAAEQKVNGLLTAEDAA